MLALLGQLVLGLVNTFWLKLPESGAGWKAASPAAMLSAHMIFGTAVFGLSVWLIVVAIRRRSRLWIGTSVVGIAGILIGFGGGSAFMSQVSNDAASFAMALGCVLAIAAYAYGLFRSE